MKAIGFTGFQAVFGAVYLGLATNAMLAAACLPLLLVLVLTDPAQSWPLIVLTAPLAASAGAAAFATFRAHREGEVSVVGTFWRAWRRTFGKALAIGAMASAALVVLVVDVRFFGGIAIGAVMLPVVGMLGLLVVGAAVTALVALVEHPEARIRDVLKAGAWFAVRRWYLTLMAILVLAGLLALFASLPAIAVGIAAAPGLYIVWANARFALRPILPASEPRRTDHTISRSI